MCIGPKIHPGECRLPPFDGLKSSSAACLDVDDATANLEGIENIYKFSPVLIDVFDGVFLSLASLFYLVEVLLCLLAWMYKFFFI